jgi:hypothetical protein
MSGQMIEHSAHDDVKLDIGPVLFPTYARGERIG